MFIRRLHISHVRITHIKLFICILTLTLTSLLSAQETMTGLYSNPVLDRKSPHSFSRASADTLELPFIDDFSGTGIYPDRHLWEDDFVFINNNYSKNQITTGIATFDALDNRGKLYPNASSDVFPADRLTSLPINLNYSPDSNIRMSFYYEAGGLGDKPDSKDSLTLQFYSPEDKTWHSVWKNDEVNFNGFKQVMIPIHDSRYLKKGFQFRFTNHASLSANHSDLAMLANCDQWNIDYVIIDRNRPANDTVAADVAFRFPNRSLLNTYEAMPWNQFLEYYMQEMGAAISASYRNNDTIVRNVTRQFEITDMYNTLNKNFFNAGATNIDPLTNVDYLAFHYYTYNSDSKDSALFRVKSMLVTDDFDRKENDTVIYFQVFNDYFAYDDGSAEAGYGINGNGTSKAMAALRYRSYIKDYLTAVRICINDSYQNTNKVKFDILVFDDNNGIPGNIIGEITDCSTDDTVATDGFYTFTLPEPIAVTSYFHVGWRQQSETFLNVGLDLNSSHSGKFNYYLNGLWSSSQMPGCIMIRPVFSLSKAAPVNDTKGSEIDTEDMQISIWPNPATDYIHFDPEKYCPSDIISIFDINGRILMKTTFTEYLNISSLKYGCYLVSISRSGKNLGFTKLMKIK